MSIECGPKWLSLEIWGVDDKVEQKAWGLGGGAGGFPRGWKTKQEPRSPGA